MFFREAISQKSQFSVVLPNPSKLKIGRNPISIFWWCRRPTEEQRNDMFPSRDRSKLQSNTSLSLWLIGGKGSPPQNIKCFYVKRVVNSGPFPLR